MFKKTILLGFCLISIFASSALASGRMVEFSHFSRILKTYKKIKIFLPKNYEYSGEYYSSLYLFRLKEDEWFNRTQDPSRGGKAAQDILSKLDDEGRSLIAIGVSTGSNDGLTPSLGVNMKNPEGDKKDGIGNGKFADYFRNELIPLVQKRWRVKTDRRYRHGVGFSLGGFSVLYLATTFPGLFSTVGSFDGTLMYPKNKLENGEDDQLWLRRDFYFFQATGNDRDFLNSINPYEKVSALNRKGSESDKKLLQKTKFFLKTLDPDYSNSNYSRSKGFIKALEQLNIRNEFTSVFMATEAEHNWYYADRFLELYLAKISL